MAAANSRIGSSGAKTGGQLQLSLDIEQGNNEDKEVDSLIKPGKAVSESAAKVVQPLKLGPIPACALYSFCSVSMVLTNKSLASRFVIFFSSFLLEKEEEEEERVSVTAGAAFASAAFRASPFNRPAPPWLRMRAL